MLGPNRYGKSGVRVFKLHRGEDRDEITDLTVRVLLSGDYGMRTSPVTTETSCPPTP